MPPTKHGDSAPKPPARNPAAEPAKQTADRSSIRALIDDSPVVIYCGVAIGAFVAGLGCFEGTLKLTDREIVAKGSYVLKKDLPAPREPSPADPAAETIQHFYHLLNGKKFEDAWLLLHPNRRAAIQTVIPDATAFARTYDTTRGHENIKVELEERDSVTSKYWVSFDAMDTVPISRLYESRDRLVGELFDQGVLNKERTLDVVMTDLGKYYDTSGVSPGDLDKLVSNTRVESLFSPLLITAMGQGLRLARRPGFVVAPMRDVWRHFILEVKMQPDGGDWKIADGLYPPAAIGYYGPGARIPSK